MDLLLLSSSRAGDSEYLAPALELIKEQLAGIKEVLFIPYAGVTVSHDDYQAKVQQALAPLGIRLDSIHRHVDTHQALADATAVMVGGGNTFVLLNELYRRQLLQPLATRVRAGLPYTGWSAGSNIAGCSIRTTNDMPIVCPPSFDALALLACQLNPHYTDFVPAGFHGETRDMRLAEFMQVDPKTPVMALPEGTALRLQGEKLCYIGDEPGYLFMAGAKTPVTASTDLQLLLAR